MPIMQVIVLAVVQGLTEFLPVSSTAHLYLTSWLLGWNAESLDFDIMLHLGTLAAVLIYFFRDWVQIIGQGFGMDAGHDPELKHNRMLLWLMAIGTIPIGVCGALFNEMAETVWRTPVVMGIMLIAIGVVIWFAEKAGRMVRDMASLSLADALAIGLAQVLAIVPGCSRSGITISAGLFRNLTRESAARFSFLLSTPAIGGAAVKALWDIHKHGGPGHRRGGGEGALGHPQTRWAARPAGRAVPGGGRGERIDRLRRDRLVSAIFASRQPSCLCVLSHCFWHNSACSGFHPPASVMKRRPA
ncbi:Undecaprenyl-diphosphatase (modular protein) [Candidatus Sulfopaludibacter sp. SbA6]|nr:Undecaprenyl-diphosphatase (modular protein) [Candidatus Sulfopaludibacter sp. SbA6]